ARGKELRRLQLPASRMFDVRERYFGFPQAALSGEGRLAALGDVDGTLYVWDVASGKRVRRWQAHAAPLVGLAFGPDGNSLATRGVDRTVRLWQVPGGKRIGFFDGDKEPHPDAGHPSFRGLTDLPPRLGTGLAYSADGRLLAAADPWPGSYFK